MQQFKEMSADELMVTEGGIIVTGAMVATAIGCAAGGVAIGYAIGTIIEKVF